MESVIYQIDGSIMQIAPGKSEMEGPVIQIARPMFYIGMFMNQIGRYIRQM